MDVHLRMGLNNKSNLFFVSLKWCHLRLSSSYRQKWSSSFLLKLARKYQVPKVDFHVVHCCSKHPFKNLFYTKRGFTSREIGGIFDLKISLVNKSNSEIEYAKVKIDYLKSNLFSSGRSHKTEYITFQKVKPKSTAEMRGPDSDRGVDVNITITELQLKNGIKILAQE